MKKGSFFRLVGFECRKAFLSPWMLIFFAALLLLNGWKLIDTYNHKVERWHEYNDQYSQTYETYKGTITADKVSTLMTIYAPLEAKFSAWLLDYEYDPNAYTYSEGMDEEFYRTLFVTEMKYDYFYQNESYRISSQAKELKQWYHSVGNSFESRKNQRIADDFEGRKIQSFADTRGYEVLLEYDFSVMLILLLSIFALCSVFVSERENDMYMLLRTTKHGAATTVAAKFAASVLFVMLICATFFAEDFTIIYFAGGNNEALQSPVYALCQLETTPLRMSIETYFLWAAVIKMLGIFGCMAIILLISSLMKQSLDAFLTSLAALLGCTALQEFTPGLWVLKWFNPVELLVVRELISTDLFVNVCNIPIRVISFVTVGVVVAMVLTVCGILYCNRSYHNRAKRRLDHVSL